MGTRRTSRNLVDLLPAERANLGREASCLDFEFSDKQRLVVSCHVFCVASFYVSTDVLKCHPGPVTAQFSAYYVYLHGFLLVLVDKRSASRRGRDSPALPQEDLKRQRVEPKGQFTLHALPGFLRHSFECFTGSPTRR